MPNYRPGRSSRTGGNAGEQLVSFTMHDAQRINRVVGIVERDRRLPNPSSLPRSAGGGGGSISTGTFSGAWSKGSQKTVTISAGTVSALNIFSDVGGTGNNFCAVAQAEGVYYLIAAEC